MQEEKEYNPLIASHLNNLEEEWGEPEVNIKNLVPFGIKPLDGALYGIDLNGELIMIQGKEKNRKTTLALNIIKNMVQSRPDINVVIDTLESSMNYARYRDALIAMLMTEYLMGHTSHSSNICQICRGSCEIIGRLSPEAFKYKRDSFPKLEFNEALQYAIDVLGKTKLRIYDGRVARGNTRNLEASLERWVSLKERDSIDVLVVDHVQQYAIRGIGHSDAYAKLEISVSEIGNFIAQYGVPTIALSQVSLTSRRQAKSAQDFMATGGAKGNQEGNVVLTTDKKSNSKLDVYLTESRISGGGKIEMETDITSGLITKYSSLRSAS